jgi:hypothetical protein
MQQAAEYLLGTHAFSSFRAANCKRHSPVVTMKSIQVHAQPYGIPRIWGGDDGGLMGLGRGGDTTKNNSSPQLVTIKMLEIAFCIAKPATWWDVWSKWAKANTDQVRCVI